MRLSVVEKAIFALHAGDGRAHHWHSERSVLEGRRHLHLYPQRWRHEEGGYHPVRGGVDAAQLRHADHSHRRHAPVAAGECGARGGRGQRPARPLQHSGRNRHGRSVRHLAGLPESAESQRHRPCRLFEADHTHSLEAGAVGLFQLLVEYPEVCRVVHEGAVWRCSHKRKRLGIPLHAEGGPQLFLDPDLGQHVSRLGEGHVRVRHERRRHWAGLAEKH